MIIRLLNKFYLNTENITFEALQINSKTEEERKKLQIKAVGSIGRDNPNGLTLKHFWADFDSTKSSKSFKAIKLIHVVKKLFRTKKMAIFQIIMIYLFTAY